MNVEHQLHPAAALFNGAAVGDRQLLGARPRAAIDRLSADLAVFGGVCRSRIPVM